MSKSAPPGSRRHGVLVRTRYHLDNALTRGTSFVFFVFLATLALSAIMAGGEAFLRGIPALARPHDGDDGSFLNAFWSAFSAILDLKVQKSWAERIIATLYWVSTIMVTGTVIGFITGKIQGVMSALREGRTPIVQSGHFLILGWSPRAIAMLQEMAIASKGTRHPLVVVFADRDREWMLKEIDTQVVDRGSLRIITRRGDPTSPKELVRANVAGAARIVVLDGDASGDATVVATVLAVRSVAPEISTPVIVEVDDPAIASALATGPRRQVLPVLSQELIARVTAQASRQAGLGAVILDLLNFEGQEIYFAKGESLAGLHYRDVCLSFPSASVIGWVDPGARSIQLNPPATQALPAGAEMIVVAENQARAVPSRGAIQVREIRSDSIAPDGQGPSRVLFVGWSTMGRRVLSSLTPFLAPGSTVTLAVRERFVQPSELSVLDDLPHPVEIHHLSDDMTALTRLAQSRDFDEVIVLGYRHGISTADADAQTMLTLVHLADHLRDARADRGSTRLIGEVLDSRRAELARLSGADDLVVSDRLTGCMLAQLAENPGLAPVFEDLFDAEGATVTLRPITRYATVGETVSFGDLVNAAVQRGDSAIGYRRAGDGVSGAEIRMNPAKSEKMRIMAGDTLVVIGPLT